MVKRIVEWKKVLEYYSLWSWFKLQRRMFVELDYRIFCAEYQELKDLNIPQAKNIPAYHGCYFPSIYILYKYIYANYVQVIVLINI